MNPVAIKTQALYPIFISSVVSIYVSTTLLFAEYPRPYKFGPVNVIKDGIRCKIGDSTRRCLPRSAGLTVVVSDNDVTRRRGGD